MWVIDPHTTAISVGVIVLATLMIISTLILSSYHDVVLSGWLSVIGASIVFGASGIPMKSPALQDVEVDSMIFAIFTGMGIFFINLPLLIYLLYTHQFLFYYASILGAVDIFCIGYLSFQAVRALGYAKASAMWAGIGMIISFLWGILIFDEKVSNILSASIALALLVIGVYVVSTSHSKDQDIVIDFNTEYTRTNSEDTDEDFNRDAITKVKETKALHAVNDHGDDTDHSNQLRISSKMGLGVILPLSLYLPNKKNIHGRSSISRIYDFFVSKITTIRVEGYFYCLATGFCDGSLMVPFKTIHSTNLLDTYNYLASFGISSLVLCPLLFGVYCYVKGIRKIDPEAFQVVMIPGLLSGTIWAAANFMSIHATYYLGIHIGFPLTQTCVIFTALWGLFYFKEMILTIWSVLGFFSGVLCIVSGSYFLAMSGNS